MPNKPCIRWYFDITEKDYAVSAQHADTLAGTHQLQEQYPIHFAGACLFLANSTNADVVVSIQESADGTTWVPVTFSTHTVAGNLTITVAEQSYAALLFVSSALWIRFMAVDLAGEPVRNGVFCYLCEYPPETARSTIY